MNMENHKLIIQYDGAKFHGWQIQPVVRTVQGDIESAILEIYPDQNINLIGSGRTDSGVHAIRQVANVKLEPKLSLENLKMALNSKLKNDVLIESIELSNKKFHARFSAQSRKYKYIIIKKYSPFKRHYAWHIKWNIDLKLLNQCAKKVIGSHDFSSFCKSNSEVKNKICNVIISEWKINDNEITYHIRSNRFLQHMVRYLVGSMIEVARGRYKINDFIRLMKNEQNNLVSVVRAPAKGLYLEEVSYE